MIENKIKSAEQVEWNNPQIALPTETFIHLLSFLHPYSIAASGSTCQNWRSPILEHSTLHQVVHLAKLGLTVTTSNIRDHLQRLSNRSLHRLIQVNLNLSSFLRDFNQLQQLDPFYDILETLMQSRQSLKYLF